MNQIKKILAVMEDHDKLFFKAIKRAFPKGGFALIEVFGFFDKHFVLAGLHNARSKAESQLKTLHGYRHPNEKLLSKTDQFGTTRFFTEVDGKETVLWIVKKYDSQSLASAVIPWQAEMKLNFYKDSVYRENQFLLNLGLGGN